MKITRLKVTGIAAVLLFSAPAFSQDDTKRFYGGIGYLLGEYKVGEYIDEEYYDIVDSGGNYAGDFEVTDTGVFDADLNAVIVRIGHQFHRNFSVEVRYGIGGGEAGSGTVSVNDANVFVNNGMLVPGGGGTGTPTDVTDPRAIFEADAKLDKLYGIFLRAGAPAGSFYPYAVMGLTHGKGETSKGRIVGSGEVAGLTGRQTLTVEYEIEDETETDLSYGLGVDFRFNDRIAANAEWMSYLDKDGAKIGGFTLGLVYSF